MEYRVVKEFPGLEVGDILRKEDSENFYVNRKENSDISETSESIYINSVALGKEVVEGDNEFFEAVLENEVEKVSKLDRQIDDIMQVASLLEADLITALNEYHKEMIQESLRKAYEDANFLSKLK